MHFFGVLFLEIIVGSLSWFKVSPSWFMLEDFNKFELNFSQVGDPQRSKRENKRKRFTEVYNGYIFKTSKTLEKSLFP